MYESINQINQLSMRNGTILENYVGNIHGSGVCVCVCVSPTYLCIYLYLAFVKVDFPCFMRTLIVLLASV